LSFEASFRTPTVWDLECGGIRVPTLVQPTTYDHREHWQKDREWKRIWPLMGPRKIDFALLKGW